MIRSRSSDSISSTGSATQFFHTLDMSEEDISLERILTDCSSQDVACRKEGVTLLQWLVEGRRDFSPDELATMKEIFKRLLVEQNIKVFGVFLDVLVLFLPRHGRRVKDWVFVMVLRLLHRQSSELPETVLCKIQSVFERIRFMYDSAFQVTMLFQILLDKAQPMNLKTKHAWLQYFVALVEELEPGDLAKVPDMTQVLSKIVVMATELKNGDVRRLGVKALTGLYQLNTSRLMKALEELPQKLQNNADVILKDYLARLDEDSEEDDEAFKSYQTSHTGGNDQDSHHPRKLQSKSLTFPRIVINSTPVSGDQESPQVVKRRGQSLSEFDVNELYVEPHKSQFTTTAKSRPNDSSNTHTKTSPSGGLNSSSNSHIKSSPSGGLNGSGNSHIKSSPSGGLNGSGNSHIKSSPSGGLNGSGNSHTKSSPSGGLNGCQSSHVRTKPSSTSNGSPEFHSNMTTPSSGRSGPHRPLPAATPNNNKESPLYRRWSGSKKDVKPRGQTSKGSNSSPRQRSVSTSRMKTSATFSVSSELSLRHYMAAKGWDDIKVRETAGEPDKVRRPSKKTSLHVLDRLAKLTQQSPSENAVVDLVGEILKCLSVKDASSNMKLKSLNSLSKLVARPDHCNWDEHSSRVLHKLMELMQDESGEVKILAVRVFREVVKVKPDVLKNVTELVITKVLKSCQDKEMEEVFCEEVLPVLAPVLSPSHVLPLLVKLSQTDSYPLFYLALKMLTIILPMCDEKTISQHIDALLYTVDKHLSHKQGSVRMVTVGCIVAMLQVSEDAVRPHLSSLSPAQYQLVQYYLEGAGGNVRHSHSSTESTGSTGILHNTGSTGRVAMAEII